MSRNLTYYEWRQKSTEYFNQACFHYLYENETLMWEKLLCFAEASWEFTNFKYRPSNTTSRQKEVQRLWQQRGLFERTLANILEVDKEYFKLRDPAQVPFHHGLVYDMAKYLRRCIDVNKKLVANVKERISKQ